MDVKLMMMMMMTYWFFKIENLYKVNSIEHPHCFVVVFQHVYKVTTMYGVTLYNFGFFKKGGIPHTNKKIPIPTCQHYTNVSLSSYQFSSLW